MANKKLGGGFLPHVAIRVNLHFLTLLPIPGRGGRGSTSIFSRAKPSIQKLSELIGVGWVFMNINLDSESAKKLILGYMVRPHQVHQVDCKISRGMWVFRFSTSFCRFCIISSVFISNWWKFIQYMPRPMSNMKNQKAEPYTF